MDWKCDCKLSTVRRAGLIEMRGWLETENKVEPTSLVGVRDEVGTVVAEVEKVLHEEPRRPPRDRCWMS